MTSRRVRAVALLCIVCLAACGGGGGAQEPAGRSATETAPSGLRLPYDVEVDGAGRIYIADGERHQVLLFDPAGGELTVVAGTGEPGSDGDGGPAAAANIGEPVGLALGSDGTLFIADFPQNRVRRVDPDGKISTVAEVRFPAEVALDPDGRVLAIATLADVLHRVDLDTGRIERLARPDEPHGATYDETGNLYFPDGDYIRKLDARTGAIGRFAGNGLEQATGDGGPARRAGVDPIKVLAAPDGSLYVTGGYSYGGTVRRISPEGIIDTVVGTGSLGPHADGVAATEAGILPSDVALAPDGALIVSQIEPEAAIRRVDPDTGVITTLLR